MGVPFHQKWHLSAIIKEPIIADMQCFDHKREIFYFGFGEERGGGFLIELKLVADERICPGYEYGGVENG